MFHVTRPMKRALVCLAVFVCLAGLVALLVRRRLDDAADTVTRANSPQFARDYDAIDTLHVAAGGNLVDANGNIQWGKGRWDLDLRPDQAADAHVLLRDLLADHSLSRSFRGTQTRFRTAENLSICFYQTTEKRTEIVFTIKVFSDYMEIEQRIALQGSGLTAYPAGIAGTSIPLAGKAKTKVVSFLAACAAKAQADHKEERDSHRHD
jgi:hypothetical protein